MWKFVYILWLSFILCGYKQGSIEDVFVCSRNLLSEENKAEWYTYLKDRGVGYDPEKVFRIENGSLFITGKEFGYMATKHPYENYILIAEFRFEEEQTYGKKTGKARDSGILIHSIGEDGAKNGLWMYSIECQMQEGGCGDVYVVGGDDSQVMVNAIVKDINDKFLQSCLCGEERVINKGAIYRFNHDFAWKDTIGYRSENEIEAPIGEWNRMVCIAFEKNLDIYLNSILVNRVTNIVPSRGKIQIQSEGAAIQFRRIDLIPL